MGEAYVVPGISTRLQRELNESGKFKALTEITSVPNAEQTQLLVDTIATVIRDNHPEFSKEKLEVGLAPSDWATLLRIIFASSRIRVLPNEPSP